MTHLLKRYFSFFGKASRQQYWWRTLAFLIGSTLLIVLFKKTSLGGWEGLFGIVWFPAWMLALSATGVRRCRDVGINPHWVWLWLYLGVGNIFYIVLGCLKSDDGVKIARPKPKSRMAKKRTRSLSQRLRIRNKARILVHHAARSNCARRRLNDISLGDIFLVFLH